MAAFCSRPCPVAFSCLCLPWSSCCPPSRCGGIRNETPVDSSPAPGSSFRHLSNCRIVMRAPEAVTALAALAHEHRLAVYRMLVEAGPEGLPAGEIAARLKLAPSSLTFHLQSLQRARLISQQRLSRQLIYAADFGTMNGLVGYLTENCCVGSASADCGSKCAPAPVKHPATTRKPRRTA